MICVFFNDLLKNFISCSSMRPSYIDAGDVQQLDYDGKLILFYQFFFEIKDLHMSIIYIPRLNATHVKPIKRSLKRHISFVDQ